MGRLQQHQNKEFTTKLIFYIAIFILVLVFIFIYGIKILLNFSLFVANIGTRKNTAPQTTQSDFAGTISIDSIPVATNSARIIVSGSLINFDTVEYYINDVKVKEDKDIPSDNFQEEIGDLNNGSNTVYVIAKNTQEKQQKKSQIYTVTYIANKPKLDISQPSDHSKTNKTEILVIGKTDKEVFVKINDLPVVVDANGNFQTSVKLKDGDNRINIVAQDSAGNFESKTVTVTYQND